MLRVCDMCGVVDEAPRHQIVHDGGGAPPVDEAVREKVLETPGLEPKTRLAALDDLADTRVQLRHTDCCAATGCPDGSCVLILAASPGTSVHQGLELTADDGVTRDDALREFITSGAVDHVGPDVTAGGN